MSQSQRNHYAKAGPSGVRKPPQQCSNPIFEQWLLEWREEAVQKNSKMQFVYSKALISLRKYPLPLRSGRECRLLEFFGDTICRMIDVRMAKESHLFSQDESQLPVEVIDLVDSSSKKKKGAAKRKSGGNAVNSSQSQDVGSDSDPAPPKKPQKKKKAGYIPPYRSGGYAILVTLYLKEESPASRGYMLKAEIQAEAQDHCDSSFLRPENPGSHYTAWNSMSTLVNKGFVIKQGTPVKFMLTIEGRELAAKLLNAHTKQAGSASISDSSSSDVELEELSASSRTIFNPGDFEIVLIVDNCETNSKSKEEEVIGELRKNGVNLEVQKLNVGDFMWVCRESLKLKSNHNHRLTISRKNDLVLPFIVERKRADDLASSIKDNRFHEQKLRLSQTGLQPVYLIEGFVMGKGDYGLGEGAMAQAIANTQIVNEFLIYETNHIKDTCAYLTHMTRHLTSKVNEKRLMSCTKEEWPTLKLSKTDIYLMKFFEVNEHAIKQRNWTVSEMFVKHLLRLRGLSVDKAQAIVRKFPTLQALLRAYSECGSEKEKELMLSHLHFGNGAMTIGPTISRSIYKLYSLTHLP